jgi:hypothetical protein
MGDSVMSFTTLDPLQVFLHLPMDDCRLEEKIPRKKAGDHLWIGPGCESQRRLSVLHMVDAMWTGLFFYVI